MSEPTPEEIQSWLDSVRGFDDTTQIVQHVVRTGKVLRGLGNLSPEATCRYLAEIDFMMPVLVVRLPDSAYVQYSEDFESRWHTDIGYGPQAVAQGGRLRRRKLFTPRTNTPALKVSAIDIKDDCTIQNVFLNLSPAVKQRFGAPHHNAGSQYLVLNTKLMKQI